MKLAIALAAACGLTAHAAQAEVVQSSADGFVTSDSIVVPQSPAEVWERLVHPEDWWNGEHSWSLDASNFSLDPRAGGCFCEALPGGGSVEHMRVLHAAPGSLLRMSGALGPLQSEALDGTLTIALTPDNGATKITWTYVVGGYARYPLEDIAIPVDMVQSEQLQRLAGLLVRGDPAPLPPPGG